MTLSVESFLAATPQPRTFRNTIYQVFVYRTRTGEVVRKLQIHGTPRWSSGLNSNGSWQVNIALDSRYISKDELTALSEPWYWSWAIVRGYNIVQAGPVTGESFADGGADYTTFTGAGLWALYRQKRILINASRASVSNINSQDADFAFGPGSMSLRGAPIPADRRNLSLHTIAKRLLENEQDKAGGALPIALPAADIAGTSEREYLASEVKYTGDRLFELTQVNQGPEIEFWPRFTTPERNSIQHQVEIGNPRIGRLDYPHSWSYRKALVTLGEETDGNEMTSRRWDRGAGFDRNVKYGFNEDLEGVTSGPFQQRPLLESAGQLHSDSEDTVLLNDYAQADLQSGQQPLLNLVAEVTMEGDAGDGDQTPSPTFDSVRNGDTGIFQVYQHPRLKDGLYYVRIIGMGNGSTSKLGKLTVEVLAQP